MRVRKVSDAHTGLRDLLDCAAHPNRIGRAAYRCEIPLRVDVQRSRLDHVHVYVRQKRVHRAHFFFFVRDTGMREQVE